jgi:dTDP-4-dehydrorhamnose reductase
MTKRLLVTGFGGFVAGSVVVQAGPEWELAVVSRRPIPCDRSNLQSYQVDLTDRDATSQLLERFDPDVIIHTAALSQIDRCESNVRRAEAINLNATQQLADWCGCAGRRLIFCSTDSVFDGERGHYCESDVPIPLNWYATTKVRAEQHIRQHCDNHVIARLALVLGLPLIGAGNAFVANMKASLERGEQVVMPANEIRTPIDVVTLGKALLELGSHPYRGIVHLAGNSRLSRFSLGQFVAQQWGYPSTSILPTDSNSIPGRARRPADASLDNRLARSLLTTPMLELADAWHLCMQHHR